MRLTGSPGSPPSSPSLPKRPSLLARAPQVQSTLVGGATGAPFLPSPPTPALALPSEFSKSQSSSWTRTKATAAPAQATRRAAWKAPGSSRKPESPTPPRKPQGQASPNTPGCGRVCLPIRPPLPGHGGLSAATPEPTCPQVPRSATTAARALPQLEPARGPRKHRGTAPRAGAGHCPGHPS